jgi:DNA-binding GntR family transcriptional regulator
MLEQVRDLERAMETDELMGLDESIHRLIWDGSHNPYLIETLERYFQLSLRVWYVVLDRVPGLGASVVDQAHLLEAILDRDPARARSLMREHVLAFEREIMAAFSHD